ncbi:MAG: hypothetical protein OXG39_12240 [Chloroflexi bacterium]|nr:hypothetical protein [Chloroflexota bacterium]
MAQPTITVAQLAVAVGVAASETETLDAAVSGVLTRLEAVASAIVQDVAPSAPEAVLNEAVVRLVGWLYDADPAERRPAADVLTASGASAILARWRTHGVRLPVTGAQAESGAATFDARVAAAVAGFQADLAAALTRVSEAEATALAAIAAASPDQAAVARNTAAIRRLDDLTVDIEDDGTQRVWQPASVSTQGGMEAVANLPATAAAAAQEFGAADGTNSISLADGASQTILWRIPATARRTQYRIEAAGSLQVSNTTYIGGIGSNTSGAWSYYGTTVRNVSGAATDVRLELQDDVYIWLGKTLWQQVEGQQVEQRLADLANLTADLQAGNPATGWSDVNASAQGGIREGVGGGPWTLTAARALSAGGWRFALTEPQAQFQYGVIRIPAAGDPRSYRLKFTALPEDGGTVAYGNLTHWTRLGASADSAWQYFTGPGPFGDVAVTLQATGSAAHHGTSTFSGQLAGAAATRLLPVGGSDGQFLGRAAGVPAWVAAPGGGVAALHNGSDGTTQTLRDFGVSVASRTWVLISVAHAGVALIRVSRLATATAGTSAGDSFGSESLRFAKSSDNKLLYRGIGAGFNGSMRGVYAIGL